jgi:CBS-domain-containing membrane protein
MDIASERLSSLRVADVMNRKVVSVRSEDSLHEAARRLVALEISAAPVTDVEGRCVGMVTLRDLLGRVVEAVPAGVSEVSAERVRHGEPEVRGLWAELASEGKVRDVMHSGVQTVAPEAAVLTAGRIMCVQHTHRLVVLDHQGRPVGMVSSMDIVSTLVNAMDEMHGLQSPGQGSNVESGNA